MLAQCELGAPTPRPLNHESGDQRALQPDDDRRREDVHPIFFPGTQLAKPHDAARRETSLVDAPPPKLAPVEDRYWYGFDRRDVQRCVPGDPDRQVSEARPFAVRADDDAADRADADVLITIVDIDRPRCH